MNLKSVVKELRESAEYLNLINADLLQRRTMNAAANLLEKRSWISAEERLPDKSGRYLVANMRRAPDELGGNSFSVKIFRWSEDIKGWRYPVHIPEEINNEIIDTVTHWMPLPELPELES